MTTVNALALEVIDDIGEEATDTSVVSTFERWVIEGYQRAVSMADWPFKNDTEDITLVNGTRVYTLPVTVAKIRSLIQGNDGAPLGYVAVERLADLGYNLYATGSPEFWYYDDGGSASELSIGLYPVPNASYVSSTPTLKAFVTDRPDTGLSSASDIPLPVEFLNVIKDYVWMKSRSNDKNDGGAGVYWERFGAGVALLQSRFGATPVVEEPSRESTHQGVGAL